MNHKYRNTVEGLQYTCVLPASHISRIKYCTVSKDKGFVHNLKSNNIQFLHFQFKTLHFNTISTRLCQLLCKLNWLIPETILKFSYTSLIHPYWSYGTVMENYICPLMFINLIIYSCIHLCITSLPRWLARRLLSSRGAWVIYEKTELKTAKVFLTCVEDRYKIYIHNIVSQY